MSNTQESPSGNMPLEEMYKQRKEFIIVALTGVTGSGCSAFAELMSSTFDKWNVRNKCNLPNDGKSWNNDQKRKSAIFHAKYNLCYDVCEIQAQPFEIIRYRDVLLLCLLERCCKDCNTVGDLHNKMIPIIEEKFDKSKTRDTDYPVINRNITSVSLSSMGLNDELFKKIKLLINASYNSSEYQKQIYLFYTDVLFKSFCEKFYDDLKKTDYYAKNFFVHRLGNALRASGDPTKVVNKETGFGNDKIFTVVEKIVNIVKGKKYQENGRGNRRFVIDAIKNSLEIMYLRERFNAFYMIAMHNDGYEKDLITEKVKKKSNAGESQIPMIVNKIFELSKRESSEEDFEKGRFYGPDIKRCISESQIHINYRQQKEECDFYSFQEQWMKFYALIMRPGIITPNKDERCMSVAFVAKLNSGCLSRQVGCTIVDNEYAVQSIGWNDPPVGQIPCSLRMANCLTNDTEGLTFYGCNGTEIFSEFERSEKNTPFKKYVNEKDDLYREKKGVFNFKGEIGNNFKTLVEKTNKYGLHAPYCFRTEYNKYTGQKNQVNTRSLHAEENTMLRLARAGGMGLKGGTMYVTASPCILCSKKAYQIGITEIVYLDPYTDIAPELIIKCGFNIPELRPFAGAVGETYYKLYQPFLPYKDELKIWDSVKE